MTLVDTSAWVEYLRATDSEVHHQVRRSLESEGRLYTTDVVMMEVLAGGRDETHADQLRRLLGRCEFVAIEGLGDFERAAGLYRRCRRAGETVRSLNDCLIAAETVPGAQSGRILRLDEDATNSDNTFHAASHLRMDDQCGATVALCASGLLECRFGQPALGGQDPFIR